MHILAVVVIKQYIMIKPAIIQFAPLNISVSGTSFNDMLIGRLKHLICEVGACQSVFLWGEYVFVHNCQGESQFDRLKDPRCG